MGYRDYDRDDDRSMFAEPGGRSALRAAKRGNPRNLPCPTCKRPNMLTPADKAQGYQCNHCADRAEGRYGEYEAMTIKQIEPSYLGDGVYAQVENGVLVLTTGTDLKQDPSNVIFMEPEVLAALEAYIQKLRTA